MRPFYKPFDTLVKIYDNEGLYYHMKYHKRKCIRKCINILTSYNDYCENLFKNSQLGSNFNYNFIRQLLSTKDEANIIIVLELLRNIK